MKLTDYHAKYFAYELTKRFPSDSVEKLAGVVAGAQVDLNPHQVDAALFAFQSPLSKGALLADEVGLGKTIEAGLVISQRWAERKRRILVITPANLRKQWHQELSEKFFLPCKILETKSYNEAVKQGNTHPFEQSDFVIICSYQFARTKAKDVRAVQWDLVVLDEAHLYRLQHPLAEAVYFQARERQLPMVEVVFNYAEYGNKISLLESLRGTSGWLTLSLFTIESFDQSEDHLLFSAFTDSEQILDAETIPRFFNLPAKTATQIEIPADIQVNLEQQQQRQWNGIQRDVSERNAKYFEAEVTKLENWAEDLKLGLEREIKEIDRQIKEARRAATTALTLEEKLAGQKQIKALESTRNQKRRSLFDAQDDVDHQREKLIIEVEAKLQTSIAREHLFTVRWTLI